MGSLVSKNQIIIPTIGLGTRGKTTSSIICKAIEVGYRHIDTAITHCNEKVIGKGIQESKIDRKEILENFLNMNNVNYEKLNDENKYADEEIATIAEKSTVKILCKN